jgi:hypothetical protein
LAFEGVSRWVVVGQFSEGVGSMMKIQLKRIRTFLEKDPRQLDKPEITVSDVEVTINNQLVGTVTLSEEELGEEAVVERLSEI